MVPNQIVKDIFIGALTIHSTEDTYQWHTVLPAGYLYYVEDAYVMSQTDVAAGTTNVTTWQINDEDGNLVCSAPGSTAIPALGLAFTSFSSTYRWIKCAEGAKRLFVSMTCSGEGQAFTNTQFIIRLSIHKPASGG